MYIPALWISAWLLALTLLAALTDTRSGLIPNWLTLPTLALAPLVRGFIDGPGALGNALWGASACGLVPLILFGLRAMGGGDVKLFAAIGGLVGLQLGVEIQLASYALAVVFALCGLAWRGALFAALGRSLLLLISPIVPRLRARLPSPDTMTTVRLGIAIFLASAATLARSALGV